MSNSRLFRSVIAVIAAAPLLFFGSMAGAGGQHNDKAALEGLKEAKIAFDLTTGSGKALLTQLQVIEETRQSLIDQGVTPRIVLAFRSGATFLVQSDMEKIKPEHREYAPKIAAMLREMSGAPGVEGMEQCSIATRLTKVENEDVIPEIKVVGNGWISLMGYQARGYSYIKPS